MAKRIAVKKSTNWTLIAIAAVVLLSLGFLVYRAVRQSSGNPILRSQDDVPRISLADAYTAYQNGEAIFLDTRPADQFAASHIAGAGNLPLATAATGMTALDKDKWYITYCT